MKLVSIIEFIKVQYLLCLIIFVIIILVRVTLILAKDATAHPSPNTLLAPALDHLRLRPPPPQHIPVYTSSSSFTKVLQPLHRHRSNHHRPSTASRLPQWAIVVNDLGVKVSPVVEFVFRLCFRLEHLFLRGFEPGLCHSSFHERAASGSAEWPPTHLRVWARVDVHLAGRVAVARAPVPQP